MGLTEQYRRFISGPVFGLIGNNASIIHLPKNGINDRYVAASACENILIWDLQKCEKVRTLFGDKSAVTCIARSPSFEFVAAGYADGIVRVFNVANSECTVVHGHKSAVTTIDYSEDGARLVTGSKDTEIAVWDIIDERGIVRLKGHKGPITRCRFMKKHQNMIVSSSKDGLIKFWDLDINHCSFTLTGHRGEVWDFVLLMEDTLLITGSNDQELQVWSIECKDSQMMKAKTSDDKKDEDDEFMSCKFHGTIPRQSNGRLINIDADIDEQFIACHGPGPLLEVFRLNSQEDIANTVRRRQKKERKRLKNIGQTVTEETTPQSTITLNDYITKLTCVKGSGKIKCFDITTEKNIVKIYLLLHNNSIETHSIDSLIKNCESLDINKLWRSGHRSSIRAISFSSDNLAILSGSAESVKIWNRSSQSCIRTMDCTQVTCLSFTPGDRHCIVGTKTGKLQLFDIASGTLLQSEDAHDGTVWSMCLACDQRGFVTGSADKQVKFWNFALSDDSSSSGKLNFEHIRTLQTPDDVLSVKLSPDSRFLAVALLDCTVKVFFVDTLKMALSLYGHKLPVLCMDISSDGSLLVSGSADRNVKIWGMDFGDCHRSLFAHEDSITCVQFIPKTHLFFSCGKDGMINQWDADTFQKIIKLQGHQGDVLSLAISPNGKFLASSSDDKSIRLWERTDEPLVLEEEQEREREEEQEKEMNTGENNTVVIAMKSEEAYLAGRHTTETVKAIEKLMEALDIFDEENEKFIDCQRRSTKEKVVSVLQIHPLMMALNTQTPLEFIMETLKRIKSSELEEAILTLNFDYMSRLIKILGNLLDDDCEIELVCKCLNFLMRVHQRQIMANKCLGPVIERLQETAYEKLSAVKDMFDLNLVAMKCFKQKLEEKEDVTLFQDASKQTGVKRKNKRNRDLTVKRPLLTL
uniref:Small-subunit processome Utp12 domain-containing protein n=1 Tax=Strigamia maritima TaxID=126957 RepID=T1JD22_STRMM